MSEQHVLENRLTVLEQEVAGEKLVTRHILEQTRKNSADLTEIEADMRALKTDVSGLKADGRHLKADMAELRGEVGAIKAELRSLRHDLPGIVADVVREVVRERDR